MTISSVVLSDQRQSAPSQRTSKGAEIRAKIAANRAKRLAIADVMKRESGVTEHDVHKEDFGGLAYIGTGRISSPEGRKIVQLYTLAHECGHIFLQSSEPGYSLPGHVKEFEAECYAHQAFREHGMTVPKRLTKWGRQYVASWIVKDRAANIAIDPRVQAYAAGRRSPYEPLRFVPSTWKIYRGEGLSPAAAAAPRRTWAARLFGRPWLFAANLVSGTCKQFKAIIARMANEAATVVRLAARCTLVGTYACFVALAIIQAFHPMPEIFPKRPGDVTWAELVTAVTGGLLLANLAVTARTMVR